MEQDEDEEEKDEQAERRSPFGFPFLSDRALVRILSLGNLWWQRMQNKSPAIPPLRTRSSSSKGRGQGKGKGKCKPTPEEQEDTVSEPEVEVDCWAWEQSAVEVDCWVWSLCAVVCLVMLIHWGRGVWLTFVWLTAQEA